jgi:hypothetical protein
MQHLVPPGSDIRSKEVLQSHYQTLIDDIKHYHDFHIIIGGDFNARTASVAEISQDDGEAFQLLHDQGTPVPISFLDIHHTLQAIPKRMSNPQTLNQLWPAFDVAPMSVTKGTVVARAQ